MSSNIESVLVPNRLEQALDLSKNVLDQAKRGLGNSPLRPGTPMFFLFLVQNPPILQDSCFMVDSFWIELS
jgi:hypothetical protein